MAETSWPFDGAPLPEDGWSKMARLFAASGVNGDPGSTVCQVYGDSSGMQVFVRAGSAFVRGHYYANSALKTVAIPTNGAGSARIDRIVLRLDPTANTITAIRIAGTAGSPAPALTQTDTGTYDLPLGQVRVEPGVVTIAAAKVTDDRLSTGPDLLSVASVSQLTAPRVGQVVYESASAALKWWNGSVWASLYPARIGPVTTGFTASGSNWDVTAARYTVLLGSLCVLSVDYTYTPPGFGVINATSDGNITDTWIGTVPTAARPTGSVYAAYNLGGVAGGDARIDTDGKVWLLTLSPNAQIVIDQVVHLDHTYLVA